MLKGSCLCGEIEFTAEAIPGQVYNCHCSRCRKLTGSAYATLVISQKNSLKFTKGEESLKKFSSTKGFRTFCGECGSRLMNFGKEGIDYLAICRSAIDGTFADGPIADCFSDDRFAWTVLDEKIEHYSGFPPMD